MHRLFAVKFLGGLALAASTLFAIGYYGTFKTGTPAQLAERARAISTPRPAWADRALAQAQAQGIANWRPSPFPEAK